MPGVVTTAFDVLRSSASGSNRSVWRAIDGLVGFIALEKMLILRGIKVVAAGNISRAFISTVRLFVVIDAHIYLYWIIKRPMPGTISFLEYNAIVFALWNMFSAMTHKAVSPAVTAHFNIALNIRWINLFIADFVWELTKALLAVMATYAQFIIFPERGIAPVPHMPNVPLMLGVFVLIGVIGGGFGLILQSARRRWPVIDATMEAMMWFLFVTSGIYESYVALNPLVGDYYRWNPVMVVIEYGRLAMDPGYPVGDLNVVYPIVVAGVLLTLGLLLRRSQAIAMRA
jgi:ABC-type polysaccharide/polyol phosphate export permease